MLSFELRIFELAVLIKTLNSDLIRFLFHKFRNLGKFFTSFFQLMEKNLVHSRSFNALNKKLWEIKLIFYKKSKKNLFKKTQIKNLFIINH